MTVAVEKWARQAVRAEQSEDWARIFPSHRAMQDLDVFRRYQEMLWVERQRAIQKSGVATFMPEGTWAATASIPAAQTVTTTSINGSVNLWSNLVYTQIPQNGVMSPQIYRIMLAAKVTTSTSPGNFGLNPLINNTGTWTTGGTAISGGSTMGATGNVALTASITNAFYYVIGDMTIRNPGTASVIVGMFHLVSTQNTAAGVAGPAATSAAYNLLFGGTAVTVDTQTAGQSVQFAGVHTVATITHNIEQPHLLDWN